MATRRSIQRAAATQNASLTDRGLQGAKEDGSATRYVNPNADTVEKLMATPVTNSNYQSNLDLGSQLAQVGGTATPSEITSATRGVAGAPLQDPRSGANGRAGALGFNPTNIGFTQGSGFTPIGTDAFKAIDEKAANDLNNFNPSGGVSREEIQRNAQMEKDNIRKQEEMNANIRAAKAKEQAARIESQNTIDTLNADGTPKSQAQISLETAQESYKNAMSGLSGENAKVMDALLNGGEINGMKVEGLNKAFEDVQTELDSLKTDRQSGFEEIKAMIEKNQEENNAALALQKEAESDRIVWEDLQARRSLTKQKADTHFKLVAQIALHNGFAQDAAMAEVMGSDASFDSKMDELASELSYKKTDLAAKFSALYMENKNNYLTSSIGNMKELQTSLENISMAGIANKKSKAEAESNIIKSAWETEVSFKKDMADKNLQFVKDIQGVIQNEKILKQSQEKQAKDDAYQFFDFAFTNSTDPALRKAAIARMNSAGYEMPSDIDVNAAPLSFQLAAMNNSAKASQNSASDPFRFTGEGAEEKQKLSASALTVVGKMEGGVDLNRSQLSYVNQLLDRGEIDKAKEHLRELAVGGLNATQGNMYSSRAVIAGKSNELVAELQTIKDTKKGQTLVAGLAEAAKTLGGKTVSELTADDFTAYNKSIMALKKKMGTETDEKLQTIFARVENIAGLIINERYGAAVTDGEMLRAQEYIPMSGNTLSEMIIKLNEFSSFTKFQNETMLNTQMGLSGVSIDYKAPDVNRSPSVPSDEDFNTMFRPTSEPITMNIGNRKVTGDQSALSALQQADDEFFKDTGQHLFVNSSYRSTEQQQQAYDRYQKGEIALAAKPGTSLHEKGIAFDITNWKEAEKYLIKYGFNPLPKNLRSNDPAHFSFGTIG